MVLSSRRWVYPLVGLLLLTVWHVPYLAVGDGIVVTPHDQLDDKVFAYILSARYPFPVSFTEIMGGLPAEGLQMASPATLLAYFIFTPATALATNHFIVSLVGFFGMYSTCRDFEVRPGLALAASLLFAILPFYSVYGFSVMGVPFVCHACLRIRRGGSSGGIVSSCALVAAYASASSPVLVGFVVAICIVLAIVVCLVIGREAMSIRLLVLRVTLVASSSSLRTVL